MSAMVVVDANQLVERRLSELIYEIERIADADCLTYVGDITLGIPDAIRNALEAIEQKRDRLLFVLETAGGYAEMAARIADALRHHYGIVEFLVPGYAMSAGTILVMSGDAIHMDYYSALGPIDPQVPTPDGRMIPALGYLIRYEDLLKNDRMGGSGITCWTRNSRGDYVGGEPGSNGRPLFGDFENPLKNMVWGWLTHLIVVTPAG